MQKPPSDEPDGPNNQKEQLYLVCAILGALGGAATLTMVLTPAGLFIVGIAILLLLGVIIM